MVNLFSFMQQKYGGIFVVLFFLGLPTLSSYLCGWNVTFTLDVYKSFELTSEDFSPLFKIKLWICSL